MQSLALAGISSLEATVERRRELIRSDAGVINTACKILRTTSF